MAPLMRFYGIMSLAYILLGLVWFLQLVRFWKDGIQQLHHHITLVIDLAMCEMASRYLELSNLDSTGKSHAVVTFWAVTFYSVKNLLSWLLLLVISTGYGVVKPTTLGGITWMMLLVSVIYFVAKESLGLIKNFGNINFLNGKGMTLLLLSVGILEVFFIRWIFWSLKKTLEKLKIKRKISKLQVYKKFTNALVISVMLSAVWIWVELYFNDPENEVWQVEWIFPAFWYMLAYALLVLICLLWPPSNDLTRYLYLAEEIEEEEGIALTGMKSIKKNELIPMTRVDAIIQVLGNYPGET